MIDLAALSLGEWFVILAFIALALAIWWTEEKYDLINPKPLDPKGVWSALKHGEPLETPFWNTSNADNAPGYVLRVLLILTAMALVVGHSWVIDLINQL
jgi:hypothetical protein